MNETPMQRALRLSRENGYYGSFEDSMRFTVCPHCGMTALRRSGTWLHCTHCNASIDIDEVIE